MSYMNSKGIDQLVQSDQAFSVHQYILFIICLFMYSVNRLQNSDKPT